MAAVSLGKNITALKLQRQLSLSTQEVTSSYRKLSSGVRINNPSDDAAGAALAAGLKLDSRVFTQSIRNINDGVSAINVAESSLQVSGQILTRVKELAIQAANGILSSAQRQALDTEADALIDEYNRILNTTEFNGRALLNGSNPILSLQGGYGTEEALSVTLGQATSSAGGTVGDGTFGSPIAMASGTFLESTKFTIGDVNGDGYGDLIAGRKGAYDSIQVYLGNGNGTFKTAVSYAAGNDPSAVRLIDVNGDQVLDIIETALTDGRMNVLINNGNGTFATRVSYSDGTNQTDLFATDIDGDGDQDIVTVSSASSNNLSVFRNNGDGTFAARVSYTGGSTLQNVTLADVNGDGRADILTASTDGRMNVMLNNGNGTFATRVSYAAGSSTYDVQAADLDGDGDIDVVSKSNSDDKVNIHFNNGNGTFAAAVSLATTVDSISIALYDVNGDGRVDILSGHNDASAYGYFYVLQNNGNGTFGAATSYGGNGVQQFDHIAVGDLNNDGVSDAVILSALDQQYETYLANTTTSSSSSSSLLLSRYDLTTASAAQTSLTSLETALDNVSVELGRLGSAQARLSSMLRTLSQRTLESQTAGSRITDIDVAAEVGKMLKAEIRQNAATALLAQANQTGAYALELLGVSA